MSSKEKLRQANFYYWLVISSGLTPSQEYRALARLLYEYVYIRWSNPVQRKQIKLRIQELKLN